MAASARSSAHRRLHQRWVPPALMHSRERQEGPELQDQGHPPWHLKEDLKAELQDRCPKDFDIPKLFKRLNSIPENTNKI